MEVNVLAKIEVEVLDLLVFGQRMYGTTARNTICTITWMCMFATTSSMLPILAIIRKNLLQVGCLGNLTRSKEEAKDFAITKMEASP